MIQVSPGRATGWGYRKLEAVGCALDWLQAACNMGQLAVEVVRAEPTGKSERCR
jgi:hypothetical protein